MSGSFTHQAESASEMNLIDSSTLCIQLGPCLKLRCHPSATIAMRWKHFSEKHLYKSQTRLSISSRMSVT